MLLFRFYILSLYFLFLIFNSDVILQKKMSSSSELLSNNSLFGGQL